jgi:hypothetical protein
VLVASVISCPIKIFYIIPPAIPLYIYMKTKYTATISTAAGELCLGIFDTLAEARKHLAGTRGHVTPIFLTNTLPADLEIMTLPQLIATFNA